MPYIDPAIDDDKLALLLANPARVQPSLLQPANVQPMSRGAVLDTGDPQPPSLPASSSAPPVLENPLTQTTRMINAQRPQAPTPSQDPYTSKINDLQSQISTVKPKWWERALGGLSAGMIAYSSHDPATAVEIGSHVTNRQREGLQAKLEPLQQQEQAYQGRTQREFENRRQSWEDAMRGVKEQREQQSADALEKERTAKAGRYDYLSMSPKERAGQVSELEQTSGLKFTPEEKSSFILTGKIPSREQKPSLSEMIKQRDAEGKAAGLKGDDLMYYKLNGKLREPNPEAEARLEEARQARLDREQRQKDNDEDRTFNQHQLRVATWQAKKSQIERDQEAGYRKIENEWRKKNEDVLSERESSEDKQKALKELEGLKGEHEKAIQARFTELGPEPQEPPSMRRGSEQQPTSKKPPAEQPPAKQPAPAKSNSVTYKGKNYDIGSKVKIGEQEFTVLGLNPKTGKLRVQ